MRSLEIPLVDLRTSITASSASISFLINDVSKTVTTPDCDATAQMWPEGENAVVKQESCESARLSSGSANGSQSNSAKLVSASSAGLAKVILLQKNCWRIRCQHFHDWVSVSASCSRDISQAFIGLTRNGKIHSEKTYSCGFVSNGNQELLIRRYRDMVHRGREMKYLQNT